MKFLKNSALIVTIATSISAFAWEKCLVNSNETTQKVCFNVYEVMRAKAGDEILVNLYQERQDGHRTVELLEVTFESRTTFSDCNTDESHTSIVLRSDYFNGNTVFGDSTRPNCKTGDNSYRLLIIP